MEYIKEFTKYKESKGEKAIYRVNDNDGNTYYSDDYVKWLEQELRQASSENLVECSNCGDKVKMITTGEFCPHCFC